ncbi:hypothetical protein [Burkholderia anthina]|uniref:hypothetical protein n=1 Tax=Burkholderia anthina TaxID=179879 RepID=UPI00158B827C|nr:hypothetical protein [Burkholderia anthina]
MDANLLHTILAERAARRLYHANSVSTSLSLIRLGGLASRQRVEQANLPQTYQYTDPTDRALGIWNDVFLDTVDIHQRIRNVNHYGPVLFEFDLDILREVDSDADARVSKSNPSKWSVDTPEATRYFTDASELRQGLSIGTFDQMLMLSTATGHIPFGGSLLRVVVDDPAAGTAASEWHVAATEAISGELTAAGLQVPVVRRECFACRCVNTYAGDARLQEKMFRF